eukprot:6537815-Alexandrium_andersonii.AAC.1
MQLCAADEVPCGLVGAPAQALRAWIVAQFHRSVVAKMSRRRQEFAGLGELDVRLLHQATRNYVGRQKLFLHNMLASA